MASVAFSAVACLFFACCSRAMPASLRQEAVNDRPVIGKWNMQTGLNVIQMKRSLGDKSIEQMTLVEACVYSIHKLCFCPTGILTQLVSDDVMKPFGRTYIPASYVKYIESGGSRVMPIRWVEYDTILWMLCRNLLIPLMWIDLIFQVQEHHKSAQSGYTYKYSQIELILVCLRGKPDHVKPEIALLRCCYKVTAVGKEEVLVDFLTLVMWIFVLVSEQCLSLWFCRLTHTTAEYENIFKKINGWVAARNVLWSFSFLKRLY